MLPDDKDCGGGASSKFGTNSQIHRSDQCNGGTNKQNLISLKDKMQLSDSDNFFPPNVSKKKKIEES